MIGSIKAELLILRKRTATWILFGIWLVLATLFAYVLSYITYRNNVDSPRPEPLAPLLPEGLVGTITGGFPFFGGAIALMLGVLTVGGDYGWGTLKTLFTQRPSRTRVFTAKIVAMLIALIPFVLAPFAIGVIGSVLIAQIENATITWPSADLLLRGLGASWFIMAVWMSFGVLLAVLSRGTALAIGGGILWAMAVEGLVSAIFDQSSLFRPLIELFLRANAYSLVEGLGGAVDAGENGPGSFTGPFVGGTQAFLMLALYLIAFSGISAYILRRRDIA